jgi:hypothetical protein
MIGLLESLILGNEEEEDKRIDLVGNYKFYVEVKIQGFTAVHTSTILLACYEDESKVKSLDFNVKWSKIHKAETFDLVDYSERHYHITPSDIGLKVRAAITTNDTRFPGAAYLYVGPVELDLAVRPEIEADLLNNGCEFPVRVLAVDNTEMPPNRSRLSVERPFLKIRFDPELEERRELAEFVEAGGLKNLDINFEGDSTVKLRVDNYSTTNIGCAFLDEQGHEHKVKLKFDSRMQRDSFYIFQRLLKSIKMTFVQKLINEFDILLVAEWSVIHIVREEEEDEPENEPGYNQLLGFDLCRELLRTMVRLNRDLNMENCDLIDSVVLLEEEFNMAITQFKELIRATKTGDQQLVRKLEKSSRSLLNETSVILEDIKKGKIRKNANDVSTLDLNERAHLEKQLDKYKKRNAEIKAQLEAEKASPERGLSAGSAPVDESAAKVVSRVRRNPPTRTPRSARSARSSRPWLATTSESRRK